MTKEEKIIATAFTGRMFIDGSEMGSLYEYMEKKVGHGVIDLMLASKEFWEELHKACEQDFIDMVSKEQPSLPSNLDEAAENCTYREHAYARESFKEGAEWMAGQGQTFEAHVDNGCAIASGVKLPFVLWDTHEDGDVLKVQIRKKQ